MREMKPTPAKFTVRVWYDSGPRSSSFNTRRRAVDFAIVTLKRGYGVEVYRVVGGREVPVDFQVPQ